MDGHQQRQDPLRQRPSPLPAAASAPPRSPPRQQEPIPEARSAGLSGDGPAARSISTTSSAGITTNQIHSGPGMARPLPSGTVAERDGGTPARRWLPARNGLHAALAGGTFRRRGGPERPGRPGGQEQRPTSRQKADVLAKLFAADRRDREDTQ
jgi:hypothetical protein